MWLPLEPQGRAAGWPDAVSSVPRIAGCTNQTIAARLDEIAWLLAGRDAPAFRVGAYRRAAAVIRALDLEVAELHAAGGTRALEELPGIGPRLSRTVRDFLLHGRSRLLDGLRRRAEPVALLQSVPGVSRRLALLLHQRLGIDSLEELEAAAQDGVLETLAGVRAARARAIQLALAERLSHAGARPAGPPVAELLHVDREYRARLGSGRLRPAPRRRGEPFPPAPVLHTARGARRYAARFSDTPRARRGGATRDWVVISTDDEQSGPRWFTVITARFGAMKGRRTVRGREAECLRLLREREWKAVTTGRPTSH